MTGIEKEGSLTMCSKLLASCLFFAVLSGATFAVASDKVHCDVLTIEASNSRQGVDPALQAHMSVFSKPPFAGFDTFKLVQRQAYELTLGIPIAISMPSPLSGTLKFNARLQGKLDLLLTIIKPNGLPTNIKGIASPGSPFFASGLRSPGGYWIFGIICDRSNGVILH